MLQVKAAECHDETCLDVTGPDDHTAIVGPTFTTGRFAWCVNCETCGFCASVHITKGEALDAALRHVSEPARPDGPE